MQMAPQIRLLQNNDSLLVERIQSTISNTLPLWKNQMVLALGLHHTQQAMQAQRAVTNMTNELLKKNAETLKMSTIETAKESERGIIDIETLVQTNQSLIDTISEVMTIQQEGHTKRVEAEKTLYQMENDLKKEAAGNEDLIFPKPPGRTRKNALPGCFASLSVDFIVYFLCKAYGLGRQNCRFALSLPAWGAWIEMQSFGALIRLISKPARPKGGIFTCASSV